MMKGHSIQEAKEYSNVHPFWIRKNLSCEWWDEGEQSRKVHTAVIPCLISTNFWVDAL